MRRNWIAGGLGVVGLVLIGYAGLSSPQLEVAEEPSLILGSGGHLPDDTAGEVPLFEPVLLSKAVAPLGASAPSRAAQAFAEVPQDHWILRALQDVFPDQDQAFAGEFPRQVTRYELAVSLARAFEFYDKDHDGPAPDLSKVALLEKLGGELRQELAMLGVDTAKVGRQLDAMSQRVDKAEESLQEHGGRLAQLEARLAQVNRALADQTSKHQQLVAQVAAGAKERADLGERSKAVSEVMSRLVVKSSVAQARMEQLQESVQTAPGAAPAVTMQLARRVEVLESQQASADSELPPPSSDAARQMAERLKRLERLVVKVYNQKDAGDPASDSEVAMVRRSIGQLAKRLESLETSGGAANPNALGEVKGLLKNFFTDFSQRLGKVEREVF